MWAEQETHLFDSMSKPSCFTLPFPLMHHALTSKDLLELVTELILERESELIAGAVVSWDFSSATANHAVMMTWKRFLVLV